MTSVAPSPEFARPVDAPRVAGRTSRHVIAASPEERAGLAARFDLVSLDRLEAKVKLHGLQSGRVRLDAVFAADLVQECVVTLEPLTTRIEERFTLLYGDDAEGHEILLDGEAEVVEPLVGGRIDIGEAVAQQLSLALDPFPRASDAALDQPR